MAINLNADSDIENITDLPGTPRNWAQLVSNFVSRMFRSNTTPLGSAALRDAGTQRGNIPPVEPNGLLPDTVLAQATTTRRGVVELAADNEATTQTPSPPSDKAVTASQLCALAISPGTMQTANSLSIQAFDIGSLTFCQWHDSQFIRPDPTTERFIPTVQNASSLPALDDEVDGQDLWIVSPDQGGRIQHALNTRWRRLGEWTQLQVTDPVTYGKVPSIARHIEFSWGYYSIFVRVS